jgi:hypothetical protein
MPISSDNAHCYIHSNREMREDENFNICEKCIRNHPSLNNCQDCECMVCGVRDCPGRAAEHYHHDGCPVCDV